MSHHVVDARRLLCPLPVIRVQDRVKGLAPGTTVEVLCTDPGAKLDIPAWCRINGHAITGIDSTAGEIRIAITVGAAKDAE